MVVEHLVDLGRRTAAERMAHFLLELGARLRLVGLGDRRLSVARVLRCRHPFLHPSIPIEDAEARPPRANQAGGLRIEGGLNEERSLREMASAKD